MGGQGNGSPGILKTVEEIDIDGNSNPLPSLNKEYRIEIFKKLGKFVNIDINTIETTFYFNF